MLDWRRLVWLSERELAQHDIAEVNLACAEGLVGGPSSAESEECLKRVKQYAVVCRRYTDRNGHQFDRQPEQYQHSKNYFRVLCMVTALWQKCGITYNQAKAPEHVPLETADIFIHGPLLGAGGTCSSLPIVYAAVGRRLGYPIKIVETRSPTSGHQFARWESPDGERFNIDVTLSGLCCHSDDFYRTGRFDVTPDYERDGGFIQSYTAKRELASALCDRAKLLEGELRYRQAVEAYAWAAALIPELPIYMNTLKNAMFNWQEKMDPPRPKDFPPLSIRTANRRFPESLPIEIEYRILGLEATEHLLKDPRHDSRWWEAMRRGQPVHPLPKLGIVDFNGSQCDISFRFQTWTCNQEVIVCS